MEAIKQLDGIKESEKYVLNPNYILKNDKKRFELIQKASHDLLLDFGENYRTDDVHMPLHPLLALLFFLFDGSKTLKQVMMEYSQISGYPLKSTGKFILDIFKASWSKGKDKYLKFDDHVYYFPKNLLLKSNGDLIRDDTFSVEDFRIPKDRLDLKSRRSYVPTSALLEINFKCATDCVYCYANRGKVVECSIPFERIRDIILEAKQLGMRSFDLCGGEIFMYENWEILLRELVGNGFMPYISTKMPIDESFIRKIKEIGIPGIQFSIDSIETETLKKLLHVNSDYRDSILTSLKLMKSYGLKVAINSQVTSLNEDIADVKKMLDFFLTFDNIKSIKFGAIGFSLYKPEENYLKYAPSLENIAGIQELLKTYNQEHKDVSITLSGYSARKDILREPEEKEKSFSGRARCSANFYAFVILPDGQVTICEELYYHPRFIIGDIKIQSIEEVWNSEKALELYNLSKDMVGAGSACKDCEQFDACHKVTGVCWKKVLIAYGNDKWDFPDPRCPKAPKPGRRFWIE